MWIFLYCIYWFHTERKNLLEYTNLFSPNVYSKCGHGYEKIFKEEESIEIIKVFGWIDNVKEHHNIYIHAWKKHTSGI